MPTALCVIQNHNSRWVWIAGLIHKCVMVAERRSAPTGAGKPSGEGPIGAAAQSRFSRNRHAGASAFASLGGRKPHFGLTDQAEWT